MRIRRQQAKKQSQQAAFLTKNCLTLKYGNWQL